MCGVNLFRSIEKPVSYDDDELKFQNQWLVLLRESFLSYLYGLDIACLLLARTSLESFLIATAYDKVFSLKQINKEIEKIKKERCKKKERRLGDIGILIEFAFDDNLKAKEKANNIRQLSNRYVHFNEDKIQKHHKESTKILPDEVIESLDVSFQVKRGIERALLLESRIQSNAFMVLRYFTELIESTDDAFTDGKVS
ncbi:MAG: hypothetical protein KAT05_03675 [Spirochaetes bacterium]|nr:hypothetical protein [Spirochaetota bacterium]